MNMNKFSIIMPSYLGDYPYSAKDKESKIIRALDSVVNQTYEDWELIIIADGCNKTCEVVDEYFKEKNCNIKLYYIDKQPLFSGIRNIGIDKAEGDYIIYLDIDDYYSKDYLMNLSKEITSHDWYFVNDYKLVGNEFKESKCVERLGHCGTSNVIHKKLDVKWMKSDYSEDFQFIKRLLKYDYKRLLTCGYYVCHIPHKYDV